MNHIHRKSCFLIFSLLFCIKANALDFFLNKYAAEENEIRSNLCGINIPNNIDDNKNLEDVLNLGEKYRTYRYSNMILKQVSKANVKMLIDLIGHENPNVRQLYCDSIECVLKNLFGHEQYQYIKYLYLKYNINASHLNERESQAWSTRDLKLIIMALENLPEHLLPLNKGFKLVRHKSDKEPFGFHTIIGSSDSAGNIRFYNYWDQISEARKIYAVHHELGHTIGSSLYLEGGKIWKKLNESESAISRYGKTNKIEDFAETFSAYRYNPEYLLRKSKEKYQFFKELVFMGVEYTGGNCQDYGHYFEDIMSDIIADYTALNNACDFELLGFELGRHPLAKVLDCFEQKYLSISIQLPNLVIPRGGKYRNERKKLLHKHNFPAFDLRTQQVDALWKKVEKLETQLHYH